jgi:hypothetical protein
MQISNIILPNLKYKNNCIVFIFKESIGLFVNKKWKELKEISLNNVSLSHNIRINDTRFKVNVIEKECKNGLKINIEYNSDAYLGTSELQRIAKKIESHILNINTEEYEPNNYDYIETSSDEINMDMTEDYSESYNSEEDYQSYEYDDNEYNEELSYIK